MEEHIIHDPAAAEHYPFFVIENHNILDLGCGRWSNYLKDSQLTPIYFMNSGAKSVVGVDCDGKEIARYRDITKGIKGLTFKHIHIQNHHIIKTLIKDHNITAIKCDIEGSERVLLELTKEDFKNVSEMAIEFHTPELKEGFLSKYQEWGFTLKCDAQFSQVRWPGVSPGMGVLFFNK